MSTAERERYGTPVLDDERQQISEEDINILAARVVSELYATNAQAAGELVKQGMTSKFFKLIADPGFAEKIGDSQSAEELARRNFEHEMVFISRTGDPRSLATIAKFAKLTPIAKGLWNDQRGRRTKEIRHMLLVNFQRIIPHTRNGQQQH